MSEVNLYINVIHLNNSFNRLCTVAFCYNGYMSNNIKTQVNDSSVEDFISAVENETRRNDGFTLLKIFEDLTGEPAKMWGTSIIGFGTYHYKSERSKQEGDWPLVGFSPRKQNLTVYIMPGFDTYEALLKKLGKHKTSVSCLYINKLADVDMGVLKQLIKESFEAMKKEHSTT